MSLSKFSLPKKIVGEKVVIRPRTHRYDKALWELIDSSRDFLRPYLFWVDGTKSIKNVKKITDLFIKDFRKKKSFEYVFIDKQTNKLVGAGGLHTISYDHHYAEFGYYLDKKAVGHGYITEVVNLLTHELFERNIHRVMILCDVKNKLSAAVAKRCGFEFEGVQKGARYAYGQFYDIAVYAKINPKINS